MRRKALAAVIALALGLFGAIAVASPAAAATVTVTSTLDDLSVGTLRWAVDTQINPAGGDTIKFQAGLGPIPLTSSLDVDAGVTIDGDTDGDGDADQVISRAPAGSFVQLGLWPDVINQDYTLKDLIIEGVVGSTGSGFAASFGTNFVRHVTLTGVTVRNESATYAPIGEVYQSTGDVLVEGSTFTGNTGSALNKGGLFLNTPNGVSNVIRDSTFTNNSTLNSGAAVSIFDISSAAGVVLQSVDFTSNTAAVSGGAIHAELLHRLEINGSGTLGQSDFTDNTSTAGPGGGIWMGSVQGVSTVFDVRATNFNTNKALDDDGGAVYSQATTNNVTDVRATGNTATGNGGAMAFGGRGYHISLSLFSFNESGADGGAIYGSFAYDASSIADSTFSANEALTGGALAGGVDGPGLTISRSVFAGNHFTSSGGALYLSPISQQTVTIDSSTFSNQVYDGDSLATGLSIRTASLDGILAIVNSTFDETLTSNGEAISVGTPNVGHLEIRNSTVRGPAAVLMGNQSLIDSTITNSILEARTAATAILAPASLGGDILVSWSLLNTPLPAANVTNVTGNQLSTNPLLGPLQHNGGTGAMYTRLPLAGSPAINMGNPAFAPPPSLDERGTGFPRVVQGRLDIGAVEVQAVLPATGPESTGLSALVALVMLSVGGLAVVVRRRRLA